MTIAVMGMSIMVRFRILAASIVLELASETTHATRCGSSPRVLDSPAVVLALHDAFKAALHDPAHLAVLRRFDFQLRYLDSEGYANFAAVANQEEIATVQEMGLRLGG
jgi:hypothetical protein